MAIRMAIRMAIEMTIGMAVRMTVGMGVRVAVLLRGEYRLGYRFQLGPELAFLHK